MLSIRISSGRMWLGLLRSGVQVTLNRRRDVAEFSHLPFFPPIESASVCLSHILDVRVRKRELSDAPDQYSLVIRTRSGDKLKLDCRARSDAMNAMRAIDRFLSRRRPAAAVLHTQSGA